MTEEFEIRRGPGRPRKEDVPVTETPEFIAALASVKAEMAAEFAKIIGAAKEATGQGQDGDGMAQMRELAMAIAEITDQNEGRPKRVPPAEMARRASARANMEKAIAAARSKAAKFRKAYKDETGRDTTDTGPDAPLYLALGKIYIGENLIEPFQVDAATKKPFPVTFKYLDTPNESMRPLNDAAKEIHGYFVESIGGQTEIVAPMHQAWISAGGLVVQGAHGIPVSMAEHRSPLPGELDLNVLGPGQFDPRRDRLQVLGTIMEPARHVSTEPHGPV